jgi:hypothetical protein
LPADYPFVAGDAGAHTFSATFGSAGTWNLTATDTTTNTIAGTQAGITVAAAPLVSIAVTPANGTLKVGQQQQFTATGTYADSTTADLTGAVAWTSDAPGVVGVDATGEGTAKGAGSAHVVATQGGVSGTASVTVGTPVLTGVQPAPAPQGRPSGATSQPVGGGPPSSPPPAPAPTGR